MKILRKEHYPFLDAAIKEIRKMYPVAGYELAAGYNELVYQAKRLAEEADVSEFVHGRRYGYLYLSRNATAFVGGNGAQLRNHGNIYISVVTWDAEHGEFVWSDAWDGWHKATMSELNNLLIEFP